MAANSRFAVAAHTVAVLAQARDHYVTSEQIAASVNTNPVVIRRILSLLNKAGVCESQTGKSGGTRLARQSETITLYEIYRAVDSGSLLGQNSRPENRKCPVSCKIKGALSVIFSECEQSVARSLEKVSVRDLMDSMR